MKIRVYALFLLPGLLVALLMMGMNLAQPAAQAQNGFDCSTVTDVPAGDCQALVALYNTTGGENWNYSDGWLQSAAVCSWTGVSCNAGRVSWLSLYDNRLTGTLPPEFSNLTGLTGLSLDSNFLTGLPGEIGDLTALTFLSMGNNQLTSLPSEIGNLTRTTSVWLANNLLTSLPNSIGNMNNLQTLALSHNQLNALPPQIGNLSQLAALYADGNQLTSLPSEFGNLVKLEYVQLHNNPLTGEVPAFFPGLPALGVDEWYHHSPFTFYNTGWCEPATGPVADWLAAITYEGTGLICGQSPGGISGQVSTNGALPGVQVTLYRALAGPDFHEEMGQSWLVVTHTVSGPDGLYAFNGLGQRIDYRVHFADPTGQYAPQYYDNKYFRELSTPITLTVGQMRTGVDAVMSLPKPTVVEVETDGSVTPNPDGTVTISQIRAERSPITITLPITCAGGIAPTDVNLKITPPGTTFTMTSVGGGNYQATIPTNQVENGVLTVAYKCAGADQETPVGRVTLYDPSGIITNAETGQPVVGATVTLYNVPGWLPRTGPTDTRPNTCESHRSKASAAPWSQPAPTFLGVIANPDVVGIAPQLSRQQTDEIGYYGWDVSEGCWYVTVEADGYAPLTSPVVGVPPEVTDLHLTLTPIREIYLPAVQK